MGILLGRASRWAGVTGPIQCPEVLQFRASRTGMAAAACWVRSGPEFLSAPPACSCLRFAMGPRCGKSMPAAFIWLEKSRGASQDPPPSLLKIQKDSVQVVDFGVRNTSMLSPS